MKVLESLAYYENRPHDKLNHAVRNFLALLVYLYHHDYPRMFRGMVGFRGLFPKLDSKMEEEIKRATGVVYCKLVTEGVYTPSDLEMPDSDAEVAEFDKSVAECWAFEFKDGKFMWHSGWELPSWYLQMEEKERGSLKAWLEGHTKLTRKVAVPTYAQPPVQAPVVVVDLTLDD